MKKSFELELMDTMPVSNNKMRDVLRFLSITNRYFGGDGVVLRHLASWSNTWDKNKTIRILDVGTGGADTPLAIDRWAKQNNFSVHITGIDLVSDVINIAEERTRDFQSISIRQQNVFDLSAADKYDYVVGSLFLHHILPEKYSEILKLFDQLSTRGFLLSDLERSLFGLAAVSCLSYLIGNSIVRHDGPLSVRRAFTIDELSELARQSNLPYLSAQKESWFRVSLSGEKI